MGKFLAEELKALGAEVELRELGKQPHKEHLDLPPVVIARYGNDKKKRTILVYGHYDVQPALLEDGWATEPFTLTIDDKNRMYGRGSTDDKGPVLGWLNAIEAHQKAGVDFPSIYSAASRVWRNTAPKVLTISSMPKPRIISRTLTLSVSPTTIG